MAPAGADRARFTGILRAGQGTSMASTMLPIRALLHSPPRQYDGSNDRVHQG
jgi:hypothetical protein